MNLLLYTILIFFFGMVAGAGLTIFVGTCTVCREDEAGDDCKEFSRVVGPGVEPNCRCDWRGYLKQETEKPAHD